MSLPHDEQGPRAARDGAEDEAATETSIEVSIGDLVFVALERLESEGPAALDALCEQHPEHAEGLRHRIEQLRLAGLVEGVAGPPIEPPTVVGPYRLGETLGEGGMGLVLEAVEEPLGRVVAVKLIRPEFLGSDLARRRFEREILATAQLQHPGIVRVFSVGESEGLPYFAMERVFGCTLAEALRSLEGLDPARMVGADLHSAVVSCSRRGAQETSSPASNGSVPLFAGSWSETASRIVREIAEAAHHAHLAGVVHRDIKPSNVMVTPGGRVLLLDFGLAQSLDGEALTRTGAHVGSLPYTAPERIEQDSEASASSDVYSLGVLLYEILTLELPFSAGSQSALIEAIVAARVRPVRRSNRGVSWELQTIVSTAMEQEPTRRYESAAALAADLSNALDGRSLDARRSGVLLAIRRWIRQRPALAAAAAVAAIAAYTVPPVILHDRAETAEALAHEGARSRASLEQALEAVDRLCAAVRFEDLSDSGTYSRLKTSLLTRSARLYRDIAEQGDRAGLGPLDPIIARAQLGLADALIALGDEDGAAAALLPLRGAKADRFTARVERLAARLAHARRDLAAASSAARRGLAHVSPSEPALQAELWLALAEAETGLGQAEGADLDSARHALESCIAKADLVPRDDPLEWEYAQSLAATAQLMQAALLDDCTGANAIYAEIQARLDAALFGSVHPVPLELGRARLSTLRAFTAEELEDAQSAEEHAQAAHARWTRLSAAFPDSPSIARGRTQSASLVARLERARSSSEEQADGNEPTSR